MLLKWILFEEQTINANAVYDYYVIVRLWMKRNSEIISKEDGMFNSRLIIVVLNADSIYTS
jgi:hypothetical protein